jgi:hypothetical protein
MGLAYARQVWMTCNTSCDYTLPTLHHKKQKHQHHDLPWPLASSSFNFIGECDCHMLRNWFQPTQHGDVIFIDETNIWCGAHLGGSKSNALNLILRLYLYHFLHTMSWWCHESIHNNTNNQQTPPPWLWSRLPLQRREFNESTPSEWRAALRMFVLRPVLKGFGRINKLM